MSLRTFLRIAVLSSGACLVTAVASPAAALQPDDGDSTGPGLSIAETVGYFVALPAALFGIIGLVVFIRYSDRSSRYRPGLGWWAATVWFNGPPESERGGASVLTSATTPPTAGGGASARW